MAQTKLNEYPSVLSLKEAISMFNEMRFKGLNFSREILEPVNDKIKPIKSIDERIDDINELAANIMQIELEWSLLHNIKSEKYLEDELFLEMKKKIRTMRETIVNGKFCNIESKLEYIFGDFKDDVQDLLNDLNEITPKP